MLPLDKELHIGTGFTEHTGRREASRSPSLSVFTSGTIFLTYNVEQTGWREDKKAYQLERKRQDADQGGSMDDVIFESPNSLRLHLA